jgi:hypothetical protein
MDSNFLLLEDNRRRDIIRNIIRDIIKVYKVEDEGEFYLPMYINDEVDFYNFPRTDGLVVVLETEMSEDVETFKVDANFYRNDGIIEIIIEYNPEIKEKIMYDLIGELNELVAHEVRHIDQKTKGMFNLDVQDEENPYKYYTQEHEIDAQVFGFKRLAKLTKTPFDVVVKRWFKTHRDLHQLTDQEEQDVITRILNHK